MAGLTKTLAVMLLVSMAACIPAPQVTGPRFEARLASFKAAGYDALTAPVGWYSPQERVAGTYEPAARAVTSSSFIAGDALEAAAQWAQGQNSTALLIQHKGQLVFERYWHGDGRDTRFNPQSMSKTLVALLTGIAIDRGEIASVDAPIGDIHPFGNDPKGDIPLENLLQMSGGLAQLAGDYGYQLIAENPAAQQHFGQDFLSLILTLGVADPPGTRWDYNNNETNLVGFLLEAAAGQRYGDLLSQRLWAPLGLADAALYLDREGGTAMYSCCVFSRPIDWLAIGQLILDKGAHGGRQLVPAQWIDAMLTPAQTYAGYGYFTWLGDQNIGEGTPPFPGLIPWQSEAFVDPGTIILHGHGSQRVWILPAHDLVIVRAGRAWPTAWDESMLPNIIAGGLAP